MIIPSIYIYIHIYICNYIYIYMDTLIYIDILPSCMQAMIHLK